MTGARSAAPAARLSTSEIAIATWGVAGVLLLLGQAIRRLAPYALEPIRAGSLTATGAAIYAAWVAIAAYTEGYRAFQKRWCPRVVARAVYVARHPRPSHVLLAPAFCMAFFHATRRARALAWGTTAMIVCFILILRRTPQPWRGIVDGGVVVGLGWGVAAIVYFFARGLRGDPMPVSAELPE